MKLNQAQEAAVKAKDSNVLVSAGAGAGKTRVLVERFLHFVTQENVAVNEILALTYTEKAANEMKKRILDRLGSLGLERARRDLELSYISTIHAFAARILRENPFEAGVDPDFRVIELEEANFLKEQALEEVFERKCQKGSGAFEFLRVYGEEDTGAGILKIFDAARHNGKTIAEFLQLKVSVPKLYSLLPLFEKLGEKELAAEFSRFEKNENWTWQTLEDYWKWYDDKKLSYKKDKLGVWKEIRERYEKMIAWKIQPLAAPWKEHFEGLSLAFEEVYEDLKKQRGFLDFDDLQRRTLALFKKTDKISEKLLLRYRGQFREVMVDEFQDTNPLQLELIELLSNGRNLFFVGDYKQSVYSFRGAEPALFLAKEKEYARPQKGRLISLRENFRTAAPVLNFINRFFAHLWQEEGAGFEDLIAKADAKGRPGVEWIVVDKKDDDMDLARIREADCIGDRLLDLHQKENIPFGKIVILFQAMTDIGLYEQALKKRGIPYYSVAGRGFYYQPEIRDMVSFLSFLENPLADIPLAAALRSPLFQVSDNTLFWLSHQAKKDDSPEQAVPLYEGLKRLEKIAEIPETEKEKVRFFLRVSGELLTVKDRLKLPELLDVILEKTSYELTVLADRQGVRRYANLKKMINLARKFENFEPLALGDFLRILKRLETREARESEAQIEALESGQVVQLMTIHKAKGLEFDVVFVADLAHTKRSDAANWLKTDPASGYGMEIWNEAAGDWARPIDWCQLDESLKRKQCQEWKRLFYVAATRAKERLIFSGVYKEKKKAKENFSEMSCWMDWMQAMPEEIMKDAFLHPEDEAPLKGRVRAIAEKKVFEEVFGDWNPKSMGALAEGDAILAGLEKKPRMPARVIDLPVSAYAAFEKSPAKYRDVYEAGYPDDLEPERHEPGEPEDSYADFGTAVHRVLERLDFGSPERNLPELVREACAGMMPEKHAEAAKIVKTFCASPLFQRLQTAWEIYRELPFVINQRHGRVEGVIDVLFRDGAGHWHVLDYKTADGNAAKSKESGYELQIGIYAFAAHKILKITPRTGMIYFLKNQFAHTLYFDEPALKSLGIHLAGLQESIINFGNLPIKVV